MRFEFSKKQKEAIRDRSGGICEAGKFETHAFYGMAENDTCGRRAVDIDHIDCDAIVQRRPQSIDEGLHVCDIHHKIKTHSVDRPKIRKVQRIRDRNEGITKPKRKIQSRGFRQFVPRVKQLVEGYK